MLEEPIDDAGDVGAQPHTVAPVQALMQQSTSPLQYDKSSYSQRQLSARSSTVRRSRSTAASRPHSRNELSVHVVAVHGCPAPSAASGPSKSKSAGKNAPPAHWPSGPWSASRRAPKPSVAILARVASQTSGGSPTRSRSTCQRNAGSESRSHPIRDPVTMQ